MTTRTLLSTICRTGITRSASLVFKSLRNRGLIGTFSKVSKFVKNLGSTTIEPGFERARTVGELIAQRFPEDLAIPCFPCPGSRRRINVVTDSVGSSSLFGGVATSLILGAQLAEKLGATLRIVTRTEVGDAGPIGELLKLVGSPFNGSIELAFAPLDNRRRLPVMPGDIFITTSNWITRATLGSIPVNRVVALVQEDERMFYPHGDDRLRCSETLDIPGLVSLVNTKLLYEHLTSGPQSLTNIRSKGSWFEPAFPQGHKFRVQKQGQDAGHIRRLFFYARPNNSRNLFWRGVEALDEAFAAGVFPQQHWELHWVGDSLPDITFGNGIRPIRHPLMSWNAYHDFIAAMDAGFVLMDTPHPSYPPLDLAATGAAVLTTSHPGKERLDFYSQNILVSDPHIDTLVAGLRKLSVLAANERMRKDNLSNDHICRDWTDALKPSVDRIASIFF